MLRPLKPTEDYTPFFVVCDIETYAQPHKREGEVLAIDTAWRVGGEIQHETHFNWGDFWIWIKDKAKIDKNFRTLYAHNGGGFDWLSLSEHLLHKENMSKTSLSAACAGSKMIVLNVTIDKEMTLHFCDSLYLLRSKLAKLAEVFTTRKKIDIKVLPHVLWETDRELFDKYHREDTEILLEVMENATKLLRDKIGKINGLGFTIGSTALKVFRTMGLARSITIPTDPFLKRFLRDGYKGGRVECFMAGHFDKVKIYDVNSLYPYAMLTFPVPVSDRGYWTKKFREKEVGIYEIQFTQKNTTTIPVLMVNGVGVYSGSGTFFSPEILELKRIDPNCVIKIIKGYVFVECDLLFKDYVEKLYQLRLDNPDSAISLLAKYLLNSLYGKFGQHAERESIVLDSEIEYRQLPTENREEYIIRTNHIRVISKELGVLGITKESRCEFEHVGIAGIITAWARVTLFRGIHDVVVKHGRNSVVYCDTDSVHCIGEVFPKTQVGNTIGKFKLEFSGEGVYAGKKLYALRTHFGSDANGKGNTLQNRKSKNRVANVDVPSGYEKVRAKGVSVGGNFGCRLTFDDMVSIVNGTPKKCEFQQFTTPMRVFNGDKSCQLKKRTRTLRLLAKKRM